MAVASDEDGVCASAPGPFAFIRLHPTAVASFVAPSADGTCLRYPAFRYVLPVTELPAGEPAPCPRVIAPAPIDATNEASAGAAGAALEALAAKIPDARPLVPLVGATLAEGDRLELPVDVNGHCVAVLATSDGVRELALELVATDPGFANLTPGGLLTQAAERGSAATIGVSEPCVNNPWPVPITAKLVATAVEGGGPVVLRVVDRR